MKNKITRTLTAFCAALLLMGGFSVTAFAQTPEETPDATNDSGVVVEEPEPEAEPLTPEGNATLVDDFGGNKQLITVTTKAGNYFYILIDRDDEGENTVHFLNQVDDADLSALLEDGEATEETPAACTCTEKCEAGAVNINCPVCSADRSQCAGKEPEPEEPETPQEEESGGSMGLLLIVLVLAGAGGAAFYYFKVLKPKKDTAKGSDDLSDYDFDDYDEDEETEEEQPEGADDGEETDEGQEDKEV